MPSDVQERTSQFETLLALGRVLCAHIDGDTPAVATEMKDLLDRVHTDGEEVARYRFWWLSLALANMTSDALIRQYGPGGGVFAIFNDARPIHFDELPECNQIAVTAVVACMNDDDDGAARLLREYTSAAFCAQVAEMLSTLVSLHTAAARCERPPGAHRRPE
jgi:hypothetical protein